MTIKSHLQLVATVNVPNRLIIMSTFNGLSNHVSIDGDI